MTTRIDTSMRSYSILGCRLVVTKSEEARYIYLTLKLMHEIGKDGPAMGYKKSH